MKKNERRLFIIRTEQRWFDHSAGVYRNWVPGRLFIVEAKNSEEARKIADNNLQIVENVRVRCIEETAGFFPEWRL